MRQMKLFFTQNYEVYLDFHTFGANTCVKMRIVDYMKLQKMLFEYTTSSIWFVSWLINTYLLFVHCADNDEIIFSTIFSVVQNR